jgi:hypothetical protein
MMEQKLWGIVLAAGEGTRARDFLRRLYGERGIKRTHLRIRASARSWRRDKGSSRYLIESFASPTNDKKQEERGEMK